jgi:hypothetical protein
MKTVIVDILNEKALNLLRELENLKLIKLLNSDSVEEALSLYRKGKRPSEYKGIIPADLADQLQEHIKQSRNQWQQRI